MGKVEQLMDVMLDADEWYPWRSLGQDELGIPVSITPEALYTSLIYENLAREGQSILWQMEKESL